MLNKNKQLTGYPSIDKPWLKYFDEKTIIDEVPNCSMYHYIYERNKEYKQNKAIEYFGTVLTYGQLFSKIDDCAKALLEHGVKKGDIVSICTLNMPETVYLVYAANKIGAVCNMIGMNSSIEDIKSQIILTNTNCLFVVDMAYEKIVKAVKDTDVKLIVSISLAYSMKFVIGKITSLKTKKPKLNSKSISWKQFISSKSDIKITEENDGNALAVIEYTGGTTGIPKGVMLSNNAVVAYGWQYAITSGIVYNLKREHIFLNIIPPFFAYGLLASCHTALCCGLKVVLYPNPAPEVFPKLIKKYHPNHFCCGPMHIEAMEKDSDIQKMNLSFIESAITGGEKISDDWERIATEFLKDRGVKTGVINGYGMTEAAGGIATFTCTINKMITFPKSIVKVIDSGGNELKYGEIGEICISSPTLMDGYYKSEKETKEVLFYEDNKKWLRTGDIGMILDDGSLKITGRLKRIYYKRDIDDNIVRVYPMRIEDTISKLDFIEKCTVVGKRDDDVNYCSIAFVILKKGTDVDKLFIEKQILDYCRENLSLSHMPDEIKFIDEFPFTRAGKVDYRKLEKECKVD